MPKSKISSAKDAYAQHFALAIETHVNDLTQKKMFQPCGDYQLTGCCFENGLLVVSMENGEFNKRELRLMPVQFSNPD